MKRAYILTVSLLLALLLLAGCMPAEDFRPSDTTKDEGFNIPIDTGDEDTQKETAVKTGSYSFTEGQYYYFFAKYLKAFSDGYSDEELKQLGFDSSVSLKKQKTKDGRIWYDVFRDLTVDYMWDILVGCEKCDEEGIGLSSAESAYIETSLNAAASYLGMSASEYVKAMYGGNVSYGEYIDALKLEYRYEKYVEALNKLYLEDLGDAEIAAYVEKLEGEKDMTLTRNVMYVGIEGDGGEKLLSDFLAGEKTEAALRELATAASFGEIGTREDCVKGELSAEFDEWLFSEDRRVGDAALVSAEGEDGKYTCLMFFSSEGRPVCYLSAMSQMADENREAQLELLKEKYPLEKNEEILASLNA